MSEKNGLLRTVRIAWILILIAGLLVTFGVTYGNLSVKMGIIGEKATEADERSYNNEKTIISLQSDLKYIKKGIDEIRGKK